MNALPLRAPRGHPSAILLNVQKKMSALSAFNPPPPPLDYYTKWNVLFAFAEAVAAGRRPGSATGSGSAGCLHDRHCTTLLFWCAAGPLTGMHPKMGASFWLPLGSYTGMLSPLLWTTPNLGCTPLTGRIPDHWGDLPDHWRLRPGRSVWPHLTDDQLVCTHNNPGYTFSVRICPNLGA